MEKQKLTIRLDENTKLQFGRAASENGCSMNYLCEFLIKEYLEERDNWLKKYR